MSDLQKGVATLAEATAKRMGLGLTFSPDEILGYDGYLGGGYAVMGESEKEAIELAARYEGLLLDPVYTGRAMAGLVDQPYRRKRLFSERLAYVTAKYSYTETLC